MNKDQDNISDHPADSMIMILWRCVYDYERRSCELKRGKIETWDKICDDWLLFYFD